MLSIILTKHAVNVSGSVPSSDWLERRAVWLRDFTLVSLNSQTDKSFVWCPLVDQSLLEQETQRFSRLPIEGFDVRVIAIEGRFDASKISSALGKDGVVGPDEKVTTTILDSDDALAPGFISRMRKWAAEVDDLPTILDFQCGLVVDRSSEIVLKRRYYASCFQTLVEFVARPQTILTVMNKGHHLLPEYFGYNAADTNEPMWIMNVHGENLANKARGLPQKVERLPEGLQGLLEIPDSSLVRRLVYLLKMVVEYSLYSLRAGSYGARIKSFSRNVGMR